MRTNKKIMITGSSGFIGNNLANYLSKKYKILSPSHEELDLLNYAKVREYFEKNGPIDVVVHCAVALERKNKKNQSEILEKNLSIFSNIIKNRRFFKKMIFLGSGAEYNKSKDIKKVREIEFGKHIPSDDYGLYKFKCSKLIEKLNDEIISLRLFAVYGKHEDYKTRFISNAICRCLCDLPIIIKNKNVYFDYLYMNDLIKIIEYFILNRPKYKFYNIGKGEQIDLLTLAQKIKRISGKQVKIIIKNKGLGPEYTCDITRLKNEIRNLTFTEHDRAIKDLYQWYQKNKKTININKL